MSSSDLRDGGVSSVIGALLVLVALTMLLALLQATTVPGMNKDAEAAHEENVLDEFLTLQEKVDEAGASGVARTTKIEPGTLYPQVPFLYNPVRGTAGSVELLQGQRVYVRYAADVSEVPVSVIGRTFCLAGPPACDVSIAGAGFSEDDMTSITTFTITITDLSEPGGDRIRMDTTGAEETTVDFDRRSGDDLRIRWGNNGGGCPDPQDIIGYFLGPTAIDILACETALGSFSGEVDITFDTTGGPPVAEGSYTLIGTRAASGTQNATPVNATAAFLNLSTNHNYWSPPGPVLRYEHGAVVRSVGSATFMESSSAMLGATHNSTSNITVVSVYVPRLNASNTSFGQRQPLSLRLTPGPLARTVTDAYNLTLEVETSFPGLWSAYFNDTMNGSGLPAAGNWSVSTGADRARLDIDRGSPPRLNLTVSTATVEAAF